LESDSNSPKFDVVIWAYNPISELKVLCTIQHISELGQLTQHMQENWWVGVLTLLE